MTQPRDITTRDQAIAYLRDLDANYDLMGRDRLRSTSAPRSVLGQIIDRIDEMWAAAVVADSPELAQARAEADKLRTLLASAADGDRPVFTPDEIARGTLVDLVEIVIGQRSEYRDELADVRSRAAELGTELRRTLDVAQEAACDRIAELESAEEDSAEALASARAELAQANERIAALKHAIDGPYGWAARVNNALKAEAATTSVSAVALERALARVAALEAQHAAATRPTASQVEHARWAHAAHERGEYHGRAEWLDEYREIIACHAAAEAAAQPKPRDESVPPPGWERFGGDLVYRANNVKTYPESWRLYDSEHGYTPDEARIRADERARTERDIAAFYQRVMDGERAVSAGDKAMRSDSETHRIAGAMDVLRCVIHEVSTRDYFAKPDPLEGT